MALHEREPRQAPCTSYQEAQAEQRPQYGKGLKRPEIEPNCGHHTERQEVSQRVEISTELPVVTTAASRHSVQRVKHRCQGDPGDGLGEVAIDDCQQRQETGDEAGCRERVRECQEVADVVTLALYRASSEIPARTRAPGVTSTSTLPGGSRTSVRDPR